MTQTQHWRTDKSANGQLWYVYDYRDKIIFVSLFYDKAELKLKELENRG